VTLKYSIEVYEEEIRVLGKGMPVYVMDVLCLLGAAEGKLGMGGGGPGVIAKMLPREGDVPTPGLDVTAPEWLRERTVHPEDLWDLDSEHAREICDYLNKRGGHDL
jgi:hypothetical protein